MSTYDDELHGVLFRNDKKTNDKQPDYRGEAQIAQRKYLLSAWIRTSKAGGKHMSLAFTEKTDETSAKLQDTSPEPDGDDIPF